MKQVPFFEAINDMPEFTFINKSAYEEWVGHIVRRAVIFHNAHKQKFHVAARVGDMAICVFGSHVLVIPIKHIKQVK